MSTPYRNDVDALRDRKEALEREAGQLRAHTMQLDSLRAREAEIAVELADIGRRLDAGTRPKRPLPMLENVSIASPCTANWDEMVGDARVRYCLGCEKNVFNLSAMERSDAEALIASRTPDNDICVRYYQRADGTILTADCPVGVKKKQRKKLALAVVGAGAMAFAATGAVTATATQGKPVRLEASDMDVHIKPPATPTPTVTVRPTPPYRPSTGRGAVMGRMPAPHPQKGSPPRTFE